MKLMYVADFNVRQPAGRLDSRRFAALGVGCCVCVAAVVWVVRCVVGAARVLLCACHSCGLNRCHRWNRLRQQVV
ncbi:hypothetical protein MTO96_000169 [Rhipicephalus appendiculatus]